MMRMKPEVKTYPCQFGPSEREAGIPRKGVSHGEPGHK